MGDWSKKRPSRLYNNLVSQPGYVELLFHRHQYLAKGYSTLLALLDLVKDQGCIGE